MTTEKIVEALLESKTLDVSPAGYKCSINLFECNLNKNDVSELFQFEIDSNISAIMINIPDGTVADIYRHEERFHNINLTLMMKMLPKTLLNQYGNDLTYVTFAILHEIGHWVYFCEKNYTPLMYQAIDSTENNIVKEKYNLVQDAEQSFWEYRKITRESAADQYALYNLENSLKKIADIK